MSAYFFDEHYREEIQLSDGSRYVLRCVRPEDKVYLSSGLPHLSERSRYRRFFTAKPRLSERELKFLTEVDGYNHFAMGALRVYPEPENAGDEGAGIVRFVRLAGERDVAEPAVVIVDALQGKGLGRILFQRLVAAARERGIHRFQCEVLAENDAARGLIKNIAPKAEFTYSGSVVRISFELPELTPANLVAGEEAHHGPLYHFFKVIATGEVVLRTTAWAVKSILEHALSHEDDDKKKDS